MRRLPFLLLGMLSLLAGIAGGLGRIGVYAERMPEALIPLHGPLMVAGFLGTVIALEKAVAFGRAWGYLAPLLTGGGTLALVLGAPGLAARGAVALGGAVAFGLLVLELYTRATRWTATQVVGSGCFAIGALLFANGVWFAEVAQWWTAFVALTIAGERLELSRVLAPPRGALVVFFALVALTALGPVVSSAVSPEIGSRLAGLAWLGLALWISSHDLARRNVLRPRAPRFLGAAVLSGNVWLGVAGLLALVFGAPAAGPVWDAIQHAFFVGFAFAMIFGHAPIIFPAILELRIDFHPRFWIHLILLHAGVAARVAGDLSALHELRVAGAVLNALAILLFLLQTATSLRRR
jgi:hypothetical protein